MFKTIAPRLIEAKLPCVPLYEVSALPAIPDHQIEKASRAAYISKWVMKYPDKDTGLVLNLNLNSCYKLSAILVDNNYPDVIGAVRLRLPTSVVEFVTNHQHVFLFKKLVSEHLTLQNLYYLEENSAEPVISIVVEQEVLKLPENFNPPTKVELDALPVLNVGVIEELDNYYDHSIVKLTKCNKEDLVFETNNNLGQFNVDMTRYAAQFSHAVLYLNKPVLPLIYELEALHKNLSYGLEIPANYGVEVYVNKLFGFILEDINQYGVKLAPNWDEGLGTELKKRYRSPITKNQVQKDYEQIKKYIFEKLCSAFGEEAKMLETVHELILELATSTNLMQLEIDTLKRFISRQSGLNLHMNKLESQIIQTRKQILGIETSEMLISRLVALLTKETKHKFSGDSLWSWNGCYWVKVPDYKIRKYAEDYFLVNSKENFNRKLIIEGVKYALAGELKTRNLDGVNFLNGFLTCNMKLIPHDASLGLTYVLPFNYEYTEEIPPRFAQFLETCWGKDEDYLEKVYTLRQAMAVTFFNKATSYQRAFLLQGVPQSGKTQLLEIIKGLTPKAKQGAIPPENWNNINSLLSLRHKLLNICGELSETKAVNGRLFKEVVDGSEIDKNLRAKSNLVNEGETALISCAHWFASNHLPITKDFSHGFTRRWLIFEFNHIIPEHKRQIDIGKTISTKERQEIIQWCVSGFKTIENLSDYSSFADKCELSSSFKRKSKELAQKNNKVEWYIDGSGLFEIDPNFRSQILSLDPQEKTELLSQLPYIEAHKLFIHFKKVSNDKIDQVEFQTRIKELAAKFGFYVAVCQTEAGGIETRYYGLKEK